MKKQRLIATALILVVFFLNGCALSSGPVTSTVLRPVGPAPSNSLTMLDDGPFVEKMVAALASEGFDVAGIAVPGRPPSTLYGVRFHFEMGQWICGLSTNVVGDAQLTVVNTESGLPVIVIKQWGPTGPCPPLEPVYTGMAAELRRLWNRSSD